MSISATTNYMSNDQIIAWMEQKTDEQYGLLSSSMDVANSRADEEKDLNDINTLIVDSKTNGGDAQALYDAVNNAIAKYQHDPEVMTALQPIQSKLSDEYAAALKAASAPTVPSTGGDETSDGNESGVTQTSASTPAPVHITDDQSDAWTKNITDSTASLSQQDQLSMIDIQQENGDINQAKQIAAALIDAADKTSSSIINHIS
jgi:hypothetical protein